MTATGDQDCTGEDFTDAVFADQEWEGRCFVDCRFTDADLRGLRTRSCRFTHCDFTRADLGVSQHRATAFHPTLPKMSGIMASQWEIDVDISPLRRFGRVRRVPPRYISSSMRRTRRRPRCFLHQCLFSCRKPPELIG